MSAEAPVEAPVEAPPAVTTTTTAEAPKSPLAKLTARLAEVITKADYKEMWGVELDSSPENIPSQVVLQKFLRANGSDVAAAEKQLTSALEWRKTMQPAKLVDQQFDRSKFADLGYVTVHKDDAGKETVITWNIYGAVKDNKATFGNVEEFIKWRAGLMELSVQRLKLNEVKELIPEGGEDPYQMIQTHDYLNVSFFRMDPAVKAASKETIQTFSMAYPELLAHKYFVNVPFIMGWMFGAMKLFLAPATLRKFHPMTSGTSLAAELPKIAATLPSEYGGKGPSVKEAGQQLALVETAPATDKTEPVKAEEPTPAAEAPAPAPAAAPAPAPEAAPTAAPEPAPAAAAEDKPVAEPADKTEAVADKVEETAPAAAVAPEATAGPVPEKTVA
ncbi:CRAL/TRIO domain protein [Cordyceps fumosorosea ARSEF 2679]|uniref:Phosphatidylinositol transfer protein SFH5 n=1 Tax=Cordyceps fumosorosea (strain ARSEF 2679) TaxID=1081104 RepID=A0A167SZZ6_CORFA|nr:CRAL/TRIO domain protein [Cordyceps fumosorosea ARSEF 2679]OAA60105.1 CRAL/TRIO domain protein [Cordyceps fumosorosea ARSEF 2679]